MGIWNIFRKKPSSENALSEFYKKMTSTRNKIDADITKIVKEKYPKLKTKTVDVSSTIIKQAIQSSALLGIVIPEDFSNEENDGDIFIELASFLINMASRIIDKEFGLNSKQIFLDNIVPLITEYMLMNFYQPISDESKRKEAQNGIIKFIIDKEDDYSACTAWLLSTEEDVAFADKQCGIKSKGQLNLLTDNIAEILNNHNLLTVPKIMLTLGKSFELEELKDKVFKLKNEL